MADMYDVHDVSEITKVPLRAQVSDMKNQSLDYNRMYNEQFTYKEKEVGLRHMGTDSFLKIYDNGNVQLFAGNGAGMIINSDKKTFNLYGEVINQSASAIALHTKPGGLIWNNHQLNPRLYQLSSLFNATRNPNIVDDLRLKCSVRYWHPGNEDVAPHWARKEIEIKPFTKMSTDTEYDKLLTELNIPV